jgi:hypothetical protein
MEKPRRYQIMMAFIAAFSLAAVAQTSETKKHRSVARLSSLVGEWTGVEQGSDVIVTYTLIGDGSTLIEATRPVEGPATLTMTTMYSVDGDRLLATHYCDWKNQPQMASKPITDPGMKSFTFSLVRVTGMKTSGAYHNTGAEIILEDQNHLTQRWRYIGNGKSGTSVFHLTRKPA